MAASPPRVTIAIPSYRRDRYLPEAIEAALAQTYRDREVMVLENSGRESTLAIARRYEKDGVRVEVNPTTLVSPQNWSRAVHLARGELVCLTHDDDRLEPRYLERVVPVFDASPKVGFVHVNCREIDGDGRVVTPVYNADALHAADFVLPGASYAARAIGADPIPIICPAVTLRRTAFEAVGDFDATYTSAFDLEMWLRILERFDAGYVGDVLFNYRRHGEQGTAGQKKLVRYVEAVRAKLATYERLAGAGRLTAEEEALCRRAIAKYCLKLARKFARDEPRAARDHLKLAVRLRRASLLAPAAWAAFVRLARASLAGGAGAREPPAL